MSRSQRIHFIIIFLLVSINLRMAFSAADPLLVPLMRDLGLGISSSGLFGLLPVMALGIAAPLGARLVAWVRPGNLIIYAMLAAVGGVVWRSYGGIPGLFGGTVIIESVFDMPGMGELLVSSVQRRDYAVVQGVVIVFVLIVLVVNLITDIVYSIIDPRISLE